MARLSHQFAVALALAGAGLWPVQALAAGKQAVSAPSEEALQLGRKLLERYLPVGGSATSYEPMLRAIAGETIAPLRERLESRQMKPALDDYVNRSVTSLAPVYDRHMPLVIEATARAYARAYTVDELRKMVAASAAGPSTWAEMGDDRVIRDKRVIAATRALSVEAGRVQQRNFEALLVKVQQFAENNPQEFAAPGCGTPSSETIAKMMDGWNEDAGRS